jgi:DamX protein
MKSDKDSADINVTSRIDYSLRFTKQAVLVIGESTDDYSQVARQYLVAVSNQETTQNNTSFISASSKLNDIQIRCRLIEQLFTNTLFDPEQSLAVSVLRLAQQQSDAISIIIEHAQSLSLQIKYELCQLVQASNKLGVSINVVLFGSTKSGQEVSGNKTLFKSKLAIIDALSGKLYSYDDPKLAPTNKPMKIHLWQKVFLAVSVTLLMSTSIGLFIYISDVDDKNISTIQNSQNIKTKVIKDNTAIPNVETVTPAVSINDGKVKKEVNTSKSLDKSKLVTLASYRDINNILLNISDANEATKPATSKEVLNALFFEEPTKAVEVNQKSLEVLSEEVAAQKLGTHSEIVALSQEEQVTEMNTGSSAYYRQAITVNKSGYVIQIAGFSDKQLLQDFLSAYPEQNFHYYNKLLQGNSFTVVTSINYPTKIAARAAIERFPEALKARQPWIKSISVVLNEMNTFKP